MSSTVLKCLVVSSECSRVSNSVGSDVFRLRFDGCECLTPLEDLDAVENARSGFQIDGVESDADAIVLLRPQPPAAH